MNSPIQLRGRLLALLASSVCAGCGANDALIASNAALDERDAAAPACGTPPTNGRAPSVGPIWTDRGSVWTWSRHHYVSYQLAIVGSELVHPVILPGTTTAFVGDPDRVRTYAISTNPMALFVEAMVPFAGTSRDGVLYGAGRVFEVAYPAAPIELATLPIAPASYHGIDLAAALPRAGLADRMLVWLAVDGSIRATDRTDGTTLTLAEAAARPVLEVAAAGRFAAWRTSERFDVVDLEQGLPAISRTLVDPDHHALAATATTIYVGDGRIVRALDPVTGDERTIELPAMPSEDAIFAIAADDCDLVVMSTSGYVLIVNP